MPFGISSAPEVFQREMHELIEGLRGVEVIVDDFVIVGYGELWQSAIKDHDRDLLSFQRRCDERGVHLISDKLQLRMKEVPFIGYLATGKCKSLVCLSTLVTFCCVCPILQSH